MSFSWEHFGEDFIKAILLATEDSEQYKERINNGEDDIESLTGFLSRLYRTPSDGFVQRFERIIEDQLLYRYEDYVRDICEAEGIQGDTYDELYQNMINSGLTYSLIRAYKNVLLNIGGKNILITKYSKYETRIDIDLEATPEIDEKDFLYSYQEEVVDKLRKFYIKSNEKSGLLVMPTGSGKTRTSVYFLLKEAVSQGYQVLWIAHRHMLIDQAAETFFENAALAKVGKNYPKKLNIVCASSKHLSCNQIRPGDSIIVASINSLFRNFDNLKRVLTSKKLFVVVDEAHHTYARMYRKTLEFLRSYNKNCKVLGITATPIRTNDKENAGLYRLFDNKEIASVPMSYLIKNEYLADPRFETIKTGQDFERNLSDSERKYIRQYKDIPETLVSRMVRTSARNAQIVDQYLKNKERYGKTLIFALDINHCQELVSRLRRHKVKCAGIYSGQEYNQAYIDDFRNGDIDVLVNVNIMTEGSDIPDIETVFLTRPTQSKAFLMQMIGRGMRGPKAYKGTKTVNIVDFQDQWSVFNEWLNPKFEMHMAMVGEDFDESSEIYKKHLEEQNNASMQNMIKQFRKISFEEIVDDKQAFYSIPSMWLSILDEDDNPYTMLVFEDQEEGIKAMLDDTDAWINDVNITPEVALGRYFRYFCNRPMVRDIDLLMQHCRAIGEAPSHYYLQNREEINPDNVIRDKVKEDGSNIFEVIDNLYDEYEDIIVNIYENKEKYAMAVLSARVYKGKGGNVGNKITVIPKEVIKFDREPYYNIHQLFNEVKNEYFRGEYEGISSINWTDKAYKGYYGKFSYVDNSILINSVLNSKEVDKEVIKFIIYHEMLHRDRRYHDAEFYREEHKFKNYSEWNNFLDDRILEFDIWEW